MGMRIAILADLPTISSGYGVAAKNVGLQLAKQGCEVAFFGLQYLGSPAYAKLGDGYYPIYEAMTQASMQRACREFRPDAIIHIRDALYYSPKWFQAPYQVKAAAGRAKVALWTPVQADLLPSEFIEACNRDCDLVFTFTNWGKEQLVYYGVPWNKIHVIPLGVDTSVFRPLQVSKKELGFSEERKLIGSIGVGDQARKGWSLLLLAFSYLLRRGYDLELYLHTQALGAFDLLHFVDRLGLKGRVLFFQDYSKTWGLEEGLLNEIYNAWDLGVWLSTGEGFLLPALEFMATGKPLLLTDMPNLREIYGDAALYARSHKLMLTAWSYEWLADPEDAADKMEALLKDPGPKEERIRRASLFTWEESAKRILKALEA